MNFLAHFWLAERKGLPLAGALLGEWVRGRLHERFSPALRHSIHYHRLIDAATDRHPRVAAMRQEFVQGERRYAGIVLDVVFDHALALDWPRYGAPIPLAVFARHCDEALVNAAADFVALGRAPPAAGALAELLLSYRTVEGIDRALARIAARLSRADRFRLASRSWPRHLPSAMAVLPALLEDLQAIEVTTDP